jgi:beta-glucanase (GH16 family)
MKKTILYLVTLINALTIFAQHTEPKEWQLAWSEEFENDGRPDSTIWNYEYGFVRNHEAQWYQPENAFQQNGMLVIEARHEQKLNPTYRENGRYWGQQRPTIDYTSACLTTRGKYEFLYGRLEVCARIPTAGGAWPAIWTLGNKYEWPSCGEIDLMEFYRSNGKACIMANAAWGNDKHWDAIWNAKKTPYDHFLEKDPFWASRFHTWRMDWDKDYIRLYLDDELLNEIDLSLTTNGVIGRHENPFHASQYILLNLALGGDNGGWIDDAAFPMRYEIDYVRVWESEK